MKPKDIINDIAEAMWLKEPTKKKQYSDTIESIHAEFNDSFRENLKQANELVKVAEDKKGSRLAQAGFSKTERGAKHIKAKKEKDEALRRANIILDYNHHYPMNKFLFESDIEKICGKYDLYHGQAAQFTGFVPEKNLKEIENFKIKDIHRKLASGIGGEEVEKVGNYFVQSTSYDIVAPLKDFDLMGYHKEGRKIVKNAPPDPVVLFPVKDGYLIITAWGDEASDPIVQNPNHS